MSVTLFESFAKNLIIFVSQVIFICKMVRKMQNMITY